MVKWLEYTCQQRRHPDDKGVHEEMLSITTREAQTKTTRTNASYLLEWPQSTGWMTPREPMYRTGTFDLVGLEGGATILEKNLAVS